MWESPLDFILSQRRRLRSLLKNGEHTTSRRAKFAQGLKPRLLCSVFGTTKEAAEKVIFAGEKGAGAKARYSFCSACDASKLAP
jgi:hypothetical protein